MRIRLQGIRTALVDQELELGDAAGSLMEIQTDWAGQCWMHYLQQTYNPALAQFRIALETGKALARALGLPFSMPLPEDVSIPEVSPTPEFAAPTEAMDKLDQFIRSAAALHREESKYETFDTQYSGTPVDPDGIYRFRSDTRVSGRQFDRGQVIGGDFLHRGIMRRLIHSRIVIPVTEGAND